MFPPVSQLILFFSQIEVHPALDQKKLIALCKKNGILVTAFSPLGRHNAELRTPTFMYDGKVQAIADKYNKSIAQVVIRYVVRILDLGLMFNRISHDAF